MGTSQSSSSHNIGPISGKAGDIIKLRIVFECKKDHGTDSLDKPWDVPQNLRKKVSDVLLSNKILKYITLIMNQRDVVSGVRYPFQMKLSNKTAIVKYEPKQIILFIRGTLIKKKSWSELKKESGKETDSTLKYLMYPFLTNSSGSSKERIKRDMDEELNKPLSNNFELFMQNAVESFIHDDNSGGFIQEAIEDSVPSLKPNYDKDIYHRIMFSGMQFINTNAYVNVKH